MTETPNPPPPPPPAINPHNALRSLPYSATALTGFSLATSYDAHRPTYPATIVTRLLTTTNLLNKPHAPILDLAAGTGKFTTLLSARPELYRITAVEPHPDMRRFLESKSLPNVTVLDGTAESIPLPDASVEVVFVAQAFHWFAAVPALREMARVLKPAGWLALVWNVEDYNQTRGYAAGTGWEARLRELNWRVTGEDGAVRYKDYLWPRVFEEEGEVKRGLFSGLQEWKEDWRVLLGVEELWRRIGTLSQFVNLDPEEGVKAVKGEFDEIMRGVRGQDRDGERVVEVSGIVHAAWARKL